MTDDELNELIELRAKARLTPDEHPLARLENLIAYRRYLDSYTQEEIDRLLTQFKDLTGQDQQDLWDRATNRPNPNFFNLSALMSGHIL